MNTLVFTIHNAVEGDIYFHLRDNDGHKLLTSQSYGDLSACLRDIYMIQRYHDFELVDDPASSICRYYFNMVTPSGNFIAKSTRYFARACMEIDKGKIIAGITCATIEDHSALVKFFRPFVRHQ